MVAKSVFMCEWIGETEGEILSDIYLSYPFLHTTSEVSVTPLPLKYPLYPSTHSSIHQPLPLQKLSVNSSAAQQLVSDIHKDILHLFHRMCVL